MTFRVDMGADVSLLDEVTWNRIGRPELIITEKRAIKKCFEWNCDFQRHDNEDQGSNLLGMDWARKIIGVATVCIDYLKSVGSRSSAMLTEN